MGSAFIYGLWNPFTHRVFYVGKAYDPIRRMGEHNVRSTNARNKTIIAALRTRGMRAAVIILSRVSDKDWQRQESLWVARLREAGCCLTNDVAQLSNTTSRLRQERCVHTVRINVHRLRLLRRGKQFTYVALGQHLGVSGSAAFSWENRGRVPVLLFPDLCRVLSAQPRDLRGRGVTRIMAKNLKYGFNGEKLHDLREQHGWTMEDLAEKLGVSYSQIARWEAGRQKPRVHHVLHLSRIFGVSQNQFVIKTVEVTQ